MLRTVLLVTALAILLTGCAAQQQLIQQRDQEIGPARQAFHSAWPGDAYQPQQPQVAASDASRPPTSANSNWPGMITCREYGTFIRCQ